MGQLQSCAKSDELDADSKISITIKSKCCNRKYTFSSTPDQVDGLIKELETFNAIRRPKNDSTRIRT